MNKWTIKKASELDEINKQIEELQKRKQQLEEQQKKQQDNNEFGIPDLQRYRDKRDEVQKLKNNFINEITKQYEKEFNKIKPEVIKKIIEKINEAIDKGSWYCDLYINISGSIEYYARNKYHTLLKKDKIYDFLRSVDVGGLLNGLYFNKMKEIREIFNNKGYRIESKHQGDGVFWLDISWNDEK